MRIAIDGNPLASKLTGIGHYTLELAKSLAALSSSDNFTLLSPKPPLLPAALEIKRYAAPNFREIHLDSKFLTRYWWGFGLPLYLSGSSFNLFHGTNYDIPRWNTFPSVVSIHDLSCLLHSEKHLTPLATRTNKRLPAAASAATMIITPTDSVKREVCEHLSVSPNKVSVIPEAPRTIFKREANPEVLARLNIPDEFILFVGTIEPRKNLLTLARAFSALVRAGNSSTYLVIAGGEGWLMDDFYEFVKTEQLEDRILFTGYVSDSDLRTLYSACRIFIYPSHYEGFGLPPLEAMACGAPVIASDIPAIRESSGSAAVLVDPNNLDEMARAIRELLADEQRREALSRAGAKLVQSFSWNRTAKLTLEVYREALRRVGK